MLELKIDFRMYRYIYIQKYIELVFKDNERNDILGQWLKMNY